MGFSFKNTDFFSFTYLTTGYRLCFDFAFSHWHIFISEGWHSCVSNKYLLFYSDTRGKSRRSEITGDEFSDQTGFPLICVHFSEYEMLEIII